MIYRHWIRYLAEAGTVVSHAERCEKLEQALITAKAEVRRLDRELRIAETTAHRAVMESWTEEECIEARGAAIADCWGAVSAGEIKKGGSLTA